VLPLVPEVPVQLPKSCEPLSPLEPGAFHGRWSKERTQWALTMVVSCMLVRVCPSGNLSLRWPMERAQWALTMVVSCMVVS
jgi:hypothetical protein